MYRLLMLHNFLQRYFCFYGRSACGGGRSINSLYVCNALPRVSFRGAERLEREKRFFGLVFCCGERWFLALLSRQGANLFTHVPIKLCRRGQKKRRRGCRKTLKLRARRQLWKVWAAHTIILVWVPPIKMQMRRESKLSQALKRVQLT